MLARNTKQNERVLSFYAQHQNKSTETYFSLRSFLREQPTSLFLFISCPLECLTTYEQQCSHRPFNKGSYVNSLFSTPPFPLNPELRKENCKSNSFPPENFHKSLQTLSTSCSIHLHQTIKETFQFASRS